MIPSNNYQPLFITIEQKIKNNPTPNNGQEIKPQKKITAPITKRIFSNGSLVRTSVLKFIESNGHIVRSYLFFSINNFQKINRGRNSC